MIKFRGQKDGKSLWGFGLTRGNLEELLKGRPIVVDLDVMAGPDANGPLYGAVLIFGAETEQELVNQIRGRIGPQTKVTDEPGLHKPNANIDLSDHA